MGFLITIIVWAVRIYEIILIARTLMSWLNPDPYHPIAQFLHRVTEPVLAPIRRALPAMGGLDLSPLIVILLLEVLLTVILRLF